VEANFQTHRACRYYVTKPCLAKALEAVHCALFHLDRGDRLALYTTHCTHHYVTGNRPDLLYPLRPYSSDITAIVGELSKTILQSGIQVWQPARPNPAMTEVVLSIVRSLLHGQGLKKNRTHILLLSPMTHVLHDISKYSPDLYIHQINPAILPFRRQPEPGAMVCRETCCKNVSSSNSIAYESVPTRIKHILKYARSALPVGELTGLSIDIRTRDGCELVEFHGSKEIPQLRLGQLYTLFARILVTKAKTKAVDLASRNPIFNSTLDTKGIRQELHSFAVRGASKVHLLDVQILYQDSVHTPDCWNYTETPLLLFHELGSLALPLDISMEVYKRQYFYLVNQSTTQASMDAVHALLTTVGQNNEVVLRLVECMQRELNYHTTIRAYEEAYRQRLPLCPGPIDLEGSPHDWLLAIWNKKISRRRGVTINNDNMTDLVEGMNRIERSG